MDEVEQDTRGFIPVLGAAEVCGFMAVVLVGIWTGHFLGGFAVSGNSHLQFNWHPLLMTIGLIFLYGNGALVYRSFRGERKTKLKLLHASTMFLSFVLVVFGLKAAFDSHNENKSEDGTPKPLANLYSLHSWMGLFTVILFTIQWMAGLLTFLFPGLASHLRAAYLPVHVFFGLLIFVMACVTALLGITEKTLWTFDDYDKRTPGGVVANWIGILIVVFAVLVIYLAGNPRFKRLTKPEDEMLLAPEYRQSN